MAEARETKGPGERPRARQRGIALDIPPARRDRAGARGQALQQGGLAAAGNGAGSRTAPARRMPVRKSPARAVALREPARFTRIG